METYNAKVIQYEDKAEIVKYREPRSRGVDLEIERDPANIDMSKEAMERRARQQAYRMKRTIKHYVLANDFDLFWTLTFDDDIVDSKNYAEVRKTVASWLKYQRAKYGKFGYIFIPEFHKSGRLHFHGLTQGFSPPLVEARNTKTNRLIRKNGKQIYNAENWKKGFSTVSEVDDKDKTASYITKYITKELMQVPTMFNQRRYLVSRGLKKPEIEFVMIDDEELSQFKPSFVTGSISDYTNEFEADISIYNLEGVPGDYSQSSPPETNYKLKNKEWSFTSKFPHLKVDDHSSTSE